MHGDMIQPTAQTSVVYCVCCIVSPSLYYLSRLERMSKIPFHLYSVTEKRGREVMKRRNPRGKEQVFEVKPQETIRKCVQFISVTNCLRATCDHVKLSKLYYMRFFHLCLCQPLPLPICDNLCLSQNNFYQYLPSK